MTGKTRIKIMTDSGSDIPLTLAAEHGLDILPFPITSDGVTYMQGENFVTAREFYEVMRRSHDLPKTAQITPLRYLEAFNRVKNEGYDALIVITLNSLGSSTYDNALNARRFFFEENKDAQEFGIHVVDSKCYSVAYGYPALQCCKMAREGHTVEEILSYLENWFSHIEIYVAPYSLEYAKRSGRIGAASAVLGEALGIRPIIRIVDGMATNYRKVRGNSAVGDALYKIALERMRTDSPYGILHGTYEGAGETLRNKLFKATGRAPFGIFDVGPAVALNIGHSMLGVGFLTDR